MNLQPAVLAAAILTAGMTMAPAAQAVTQNRFQESPAGSSCQLSVPTTASVVRPRATGFRNEGTTGQFVICQMDSSTGALNAALMLAQSLDGTVKNITCTAADGYNFSNGGGPVTIQYSTQTAATNSTGGFYAQFLWDASNFGGTAGADFTGIFSVTCLLPPQSELKFSEIGYNEDVGA